MTAPTGAPPRFDARFRAEFETLLRWRRDVRRFRTDPLDDGLVEEILRLADLSPSVGNSQPWRIVLVESAPVRAAVQASFEAENARAAEAYDSERSALYARLKLAGLKEAPVQLAIFCDPDPLQGQGLGRATMPATLAHSVAGMVQALWLAARMLGVGVGWVSILDPQAVQGALDVPPNWQLVAYLCLGYPVEEHIDPELEREGWQARTPLSTRLLSR